MTFSEQQLRAALLELDNLVTPTSPPPQFGPRPRHWMLLAPVAVSLLVVAVAVPIALTGHRSPHQAATTTAPTHVASAPGSGPVTAVPTAKGPVEVTLVLSRTETVAGTRIPGRLIVDNTTASPITLAGCGDTYEVGLAGSGIGGISALLMCPPPILSVGVTTIPFEILTSYYAWPDPCGDHVGHCVEPGPPPMAPGVYQTVVIIQGLPTGSQLPPAIAVTLTGASSAGSGAPTSAPASTPHVMIPQVLDQAVTSAVSNLRAAGLNPVVKYTYDTGAPRGTVVAVSPAAGTLAAAGSAVTLVVAR